MPNEIHTLVTSITPGRFSLDDPEHGHDLTSGEAIAIQVLANTWIEGRIEHAGGYDSDGCYTVADAGKGAQKPPMPTQEQLQQRLDAGESLEELLMAASGPRTVGVFRGYYFISVTGQVVGLCTGMKVRSR